MYLRLIAVWALKPHWATPWLDVMHGLSAWKQAQKHPHFHEHMDIDTLIFRTRFEARWGLLKLSHQIFQFFLFLTFINTAHFPDTLWLSSHSQLRGGEMSATSIIIYRSKTISYLSLSNVYSDSQLIPKGQRFLHGFKALNKTYFINLWGGLSPILGDEKHFRSS